MKEGSEGRKEDSNEAMKEDNNVGDGGGRSERK